MVKLFVSDRGSSVSLLGQDMKKRFKLGYIHCCSGLRKSRSYSVAPEKNYLFVQIDYLDECPVCGHTIVQLTRIDTDNNVSICTKANEKARKLFESLRDSILFEKKTESGRVRVNSKFYLSYNEFGVKKKCYSNLSTLKIGLFENKELKHFEKV